MKLSELCDSPVVLVTNHDDWNALYINGTAKEQAHNIDADTLVKECLKVGKHYCTVYSDYDELQIEGQYPDKLDDIPSHIEIEQSADK